MRRFRIPMFGVILGLTGSVWAVPAPADRLVGLALENAKKFHKGVLVVFQTSWVGWCSQMDKALAIPAIKGVMDKDFVVVRLKIFEGPFRQLIENPGSFQLLDKWGGREAGVPYIVSLDQTGRVVANSIVQVQANPAPQNIGYPLESFEIRKFIEMLKLANPAISQEDLNTVQRSLETRAAKIKNPS